MNNYSILLFTMSFIFLSIIYVFDITFNIINYFNNLFYMLYGFVAGVIYSFIF